MGSEDEVVVGEGIVLSGLVVFEFVHAVVESLEGVIKHGHIGVEIAGYIAVAGAVATLVPVGVVPSVAAEEELAPVAEAAPSGHELRDLEELPGEVGQDVQGVIAAAVDGRGIDPVLDEEGGRDVGPGRPPAVHRSGMEPCAGLLKGGADVAFILASLADHIGIAFLKEVGVRVVHDILEGLEALGGGI
jgi:hypothetical protein